MIDLDTFVSAMKILGYVDFTTILNHHGLKLRNYVKDQLLKLFYLGQLMLSEYG